MSWHRSGLVIQIATSEDGYARFLETLGLEDPDFEQKASFDDAMDAISEEGVAIACADGWTSVWGSLLFVSDEVLRKLSQKSNAFVFMLEGASGSYSFEWWAKGSRKRKWFTQEGKVHIDEGKPLPQEKQAFEEEGDDEDYIFSLMGKLTIPFRRLTKPKFHVFQITDEVSTPVQSDCVLCGGSGKCYCIRKGPGNPAGCARCTGTGKCNVCGGKGKK